MGVRLSVLDSGEIQSIYGAALEILDRTGAVIEEPEAVALLCRAGAHLDDGARVHIPRVLIEQALSSAPAQVPVYDRLGNLAMLLGSEKAYFGAHQTCPRVLDWVSGRWEQTTFDYCSKVSRVIDALSNITHMSVGDYVADARTEYADLACVSAAIMNSSKPMGMTCLSMESEKLVIDIAAAAVGGFAQLRAKPFILMCDSSVAPLYHPREPLQKLIFAARQGLPCIYNPMPQGGLTAPATMAGVLVVTLAEVLTCLVVLQLANPGTGFICGGVPSMFDMKDMTFVYGSPELFLMCSALTDIAHYYNLPSFGTAGMTNSKYPDLQATVDASLSSLMAVLSRSNLIHDVGIIDINGHSLPMIVLVDEIAGMLRHIENGISVNEETLAIDVIDHVGSRGSFIVEDHTIRHFRECWYPSVFDHAIASSFSKATPIEERLNNRIEHILNEHCPATLPNEAIAMIDDLRPLWAS